jgi:drug/metabolite transporter (DMT)-like permease
MKNNSRRIILLLILVISGLMVFTDQAYAYIDPGTGSMIVQTLIAAVAVVGVSLGIFRNRLRHLWNRLLRLKKE